MTLDVFLAEFVPVVTGALIAALAGAVVATHDARHARRRQEAQRQADAEAERQRERRRLDESAAEAAAEALLSHRLAAPPQLGHVISAEGADDLIQRTWTATEGARMALARVMTRHYDDGIAELAEDAFGTVTVAGNTFRQAAQKLVNQYARGLPPRVDVGEATDAYGEADEALNRLIDAVRSNLRRSMDVGTQSTYPSGVRP